MPIRIATQQDLLPSARIYAAAFKDEALFGQHFHPRRSQYPNDMQLFFLRGNRSALYGGPDHRCLVSYMEQSEDKPEKITGWAHWVRKRKVPRPPTVTQWVLQRVVEAYNYIEAVFYPDRALDSSRLSMLPRMDQLLKPVYTGDRAESWYLSSLGVDPAIQKTGHGRQLVAWGLERAREEGVSASVVSSAGNERFYQTCGFDVALGRVPDIDEPDNPFKDIEGGAIFFKDPPMIK